jgi:8-oxo-dGTP pyrophosphatase MutT (NUDIX family)
MASSIRAAATAICVRTGPGGGPEVLALRRGPAMRFLPGYVAFPGGAVDPADVAHAVAWFGGKADAHRAAAIRELIEEVGLSLTADGLVAGGLVDIDAGPPEPAALHELAHWIAPLEVPVRFDTRYFVVRADVGIDPKPDGHEAVDAWWVSPADLMAGWEAGEHKLYWPTWYTVRHLAACASAEELARLEFATREPTEDEIDAMPRHVMENER